MSSAISAGRSGAAAREGFIVAAFALTVFCGSFLLFLVEPIIAKELLPWFGGAANVWATCLVFFQVGLLLGYAYADALARRLSPRAQLASLIALLGAAALLLPIVPARHWATPSATWGPAARVLGALATTIGAPYVLMSATSPLVQSWYARRFPGRSPYRLFALSNLASMLALLAYPSLIEPRLGTRLQSYCWSAAYGAWALLMLVCAASAHGLASERDVQLALPADSASVTAPSHLRYLSWLGLAALGSLLLIAVTGHMTRDVAAIPLLWVLPLAVYLLTFIGSFQMSGWLTSGRLTGVALATLALYGGYSLYLNWPGGDADNTLPIGWQILVLCTVLGGACLFCHGTLARTRPAPGHLTRFYLTIALGGALGSIVVGLGAPALLPVDFDLEGGMLGFAAVIVYATWQGPGSGTHATHGDSGAGYVVRYWSRLLGLIAFAATAAAVAIIIQQFYDGTILTRRNFYGSLRVYEWKAGRVGTARSLSNGVILHGTQYFAPSARRRPTEYYAEPSGVGRAILALHGSAGSPLRIGVIGLGVGTLAAYGRPGDVIRFYEINPMVLDIARHEFTYLAESAARIEVALGDARLSLEREPPERFDLIAVDAFSSDAIPVHLLTREALEVYLKHLRPGGVVAFHTSNRYVDLPPVVARIAELRGLTARLVETDADDTFNTPSSWVLVSGDSRFFATPQIGKAATKVAHGPTRAWTDDFSDLMEYLQ